MSLNPISLNRHDSYLIMDGDGNILFHVTGNDANYSTISSVNMFIKLKYDEHQSKVRRYCILEKILQRNIQKEKIKLYGWLSNFDERIKYCKLLISNRMCNNIELKSCAEIDNNSYIENVRLQEKHLIAKQGITLRYENHRSTVEINKMLLELYQCRNRTIYRLNNIYTARYEEYLAELSEGDADSMRWGRSGNVSKYKPYTYKKIPSILDNTITDGIIESIDVLKEFNTFADELESTIRKH